MSDYHEPSEELSAEDRDLHRALTSFKEEIEAVDWYHQRVSLTTDESLRSVLAHNRDEEIEHACMTLEWLRRRVPTWDRHLSNYLFTSGDIAGRDRHVSSRMDSSRGLDVGPLSPSETEAGTGREKQDGNEHDERIPKAGRDRAESIVAPETRVLKS